MHNLFSLGAVPVDSKASELKFWTKNDGQVSYQEFRVVVESRDLFCLFVRLFFIKLFIYLFSFFSVFVSFTKEIICLFQVFIHPSR